MGWVTLTLRKAELKRTHADYQMELLNISRTKRQMARRYSYQQTVKQNDMNQELNDLYAKYVTQRDAIKGTTSNDDGEEKINADGSTGTGTDSDSKTTIEEYNEMQQELADLKENYQEQKNDIKEDWEDQLAWIEEEANDTETMLDQEQVEIEAQLEAISAEIESVGEAVSSQIQSSTIKLS